MAAIQKIVERLDAIDGMPFGKVGHELDMLALDVQRAIAERKMLIDIIAEMVVRHGGLMASPLMRRAQEILDMECKGAA